MIKEMIAGCERGCIKWWQFLMFFGTIVAILVAGGWAVAVTKVDTSAFDEHQKRYNIIQEDMKSEVCDIKVMVTKLYNEGTSKDHQWPLPNCDKVVVR